MKLRCLDRILAWESWRTIRGVKAVSFEEYCLPAGLGLPEHLPSALALESVFELARWLVVLSSEFQRIALPVELERCTFSHPLRPGEHMQIELTMRPETEGEIVFAAQARTRTAEILHVETARARLLPLPDYLDSADMRVLYGELHRPEAVRA
jgi:3-hydroxymyristoyl/3-hydroxydecanoyl-(acyl carrier protein) dehydratase